MKLPVLLEDAFLCIMVNLDYRKCFQLYEKINSVTHSVGSTGMIVIFWHLKSHSESVVGFLLLKIQASFLSADIHRLSTFFSWSWPTLGQSNFTVHKGKLSLRSSGCIQENCKVA